MRKPYRPEPKSPVARSSWYRHWPPGPSFDQLLGWLFRPKPGGRKRGFCRLNLEELEDRRVLSLMPAGNEFLVNQTIVGMEVTQSQRSVAAAPDGRSVVVWQGPQGNSTGIFARIFKADGSPLTGEMAVSQYTTGLEAFASAAMDADGDFVVTWSSLLQDGDGYSIYARRYNAAGQAVGNEFQVNQFITGDQKLSSVAVDAAGDFTISWQSANQNSPGNAVFARRFSAAGQALSDEFQVNQFANGTEDSAAVAMDAAGDFTIAWQAYPGTGTGYNVYARRYSAAGSAVTGDFLVNQINQFTTSDQRNPSVAMDAAGDFVVGWQSNLQDGSNLGVVARRFSASGQALTGEFPVNQFTIGNQELPSVAMDAAGQFIVSWQSQGEDGSGYGVYARRYSPAGAPLTGAFPVNQVTTSDQANASVATDADGDAVFAWSSNGQDTSGLGVYARRYTNTDSGADAAGPLIGGVYAGTGSLVSGRAIAPGQSLAADVPELAVTFSEALNTASATAAANWALTRGGVDVSNRISGVGYAFDATVNKYVVTLNLAPPLSDGAYVLTARGAITDAGGNRLDGDLDGSNTGQDAALAFTIARPVPVGDEFRVNETTNGYQFGPTVAAAPDGRSVVTWTGQDGDSEGIYAWVYKADGMPLTGEFLVNQYTTDGQNSPSAAMDAQGDFVVTWQSFTQDGNPFDFAVYARRYSAAGAALGNEFQVNQVTTDQQERPNVAMDAAGDFVITWQSKGQDGSGYGIFARRYDAAGLARGDEFQVNQYTSGAQVFSSLAMDAAGDFVVAWESISQPGGSLADIYARRYIATGAAQGDEFLVNQVTTDGQVGPSVAMDAQGDFVVAWGSKGQDGDRYGIFARRYGPGGQARSDEFQVNQVTTDQQLEPRAAMDAQGDFAVSWDSTGQDGSGNGVFARRYDAGGHAGGDEFQVNQYTTGNQDRSGAAMDAAGDLIVAWTSYGQDGSGDGVYAQRYEPTAVLNSVSEAGADIPIAVNQRPPGPILAGPSFVAQFSRAMDPTTTQTVTNWALTYNGADISAQITTVTYNAATLQATLTLQIALGDGSYVLTAKTGILDSDGRPLDGLFTGSPGSGGYVLPFTVQVPVPLPAYGVNVTTAGNQTLTDTVPNNGRSVAIAPDGRSVVTWASSDGDMDGIFARRYTADGTPLTGEFRVNQVTIGRQHEPSVAMDTAGDFIVVWSSSGQDGDRDGVFARRYGAAGPALGSEFQVNQFTTDNQDEARVAMDAEGDFVVTWTSTGQDGSSDGVFARRYDASGAALGNEFEVNQYTNDDQGFSSVAMDAAGDFVVTWTTYGQVSRQDVYARRYNTLGMALADEFRVNQFTTGGQTTSSVAMDAAGDFILSWQSAGQDGSGYGVHARRYRADGIAEGNEFPVNQYTTGDQGNSSVAMDASGDFVITWSSGQDGSTDGIVARRYGTAGLALAAEFPVNLYTTGEQYASSVAMDAAGDFVIGWQSDGQDGAAYGIYARRYVALPAGFAYDPATQTLTITTPADSTFTFAQTTTADSANKTHTTDTFTLNGTSEAVYDAGLSHAVVNGAGNASTAILITNDTYQDTNGATQETAESIALGSLNNAGVGTIRKLDANGSTYTLLTLSGFPISYAYAGRHDGTVQLYGTAGVPYNGFVSAGNYSYVGGPGLFHLAQGAPYVYGYSAGQATDFAYHYAANAGSAFVVSGTAFSYMSASDTVNSVTQSYFNVGVGFLQNTGVAKNPGKDFAYIIDSPGNDTFVGGTPYSYMFIAGTTSPFAEFDAAYGFALVFGQSFVGGTDTATNSDPTRNILVGFRLR